MELIPLKSRRFQKGSPLSPLLRESLKAAPPRSANQYPRPNQSPGGPKAPQGESLLDGDILVIASKVLAYSQGLLVRVADADDFRELVRREADRVLYEGDMVLTLKNNVLIPNAGIDQSNTPEGEAVLWPEKPFEAARSLRTELMGEFGLSRLGIVISDSHCQPLRVGTTGIAIGWAGFEGVVDERGAKDLYGRKMAYTQIAVADNLASAANLLMGETDASVPFVIVRAFAAHFTEKEASDGDYFMEPGKCLYSPLYRFGP